MQFPPQLIVVAGPNGAGKSTYSGASYVSGFLLLDPDRYGIRPDIDDPIAAGRLVVRRVWSALAAGEDVVLETTLSGHFPLNIIAAAKRGGYHVALIYVGLANADECVRRVRERVVRGGHDVAESDIRRRFDRSIESLPSVILSVDHVTMYDNSRTEPYRLVLLSDFTTIVLNDVPQWAAEAVAAVQRRRNAR